MAGLRTSQWLGTLFDGMTRHTEEACRWAESVSKKGLREGIRERDRPRGDYRERERATDQELFRCTRRLYGNTMRIAKKTL